MARNISGENWTEENERRTKRKIGWLPLPTKPKLDISVHQGQIWGPLQGLRIRKSLWLWIAITLLFISNVIYAVAFLTNNWGVLLVDLNKPTANNVSNDRVDTYNTQQQDTFTSHENLTWGEYWFGKPIITPDHNAVFSAEGVQQNQTSEHSRQGVFMENERYWEFGLWECCRNDGFCLGTRWPGEGKIIVNYFCPISYCWYHCHTYTSICHDRTYICRDRT